MTLETFPENVTRSFSIIANEAFETTKAMYEGANRTMQMNLRFPFRTVEIPYNKITATGWPILHSFFRHRFGGYETFWFFDIEKKNQVDEYVGRGDGSTATFDLHSKTTDNDTTLKIYVNGVEKTKVTHYNFVSGGGEGGADRITFTAGNIPASGALITSDFTGYLRLKCTLGDGFRDEWFRHQHHKTNLILEEFQW